MFKLTLPDPAVFCCISSESDIPLQGRLDRIQTNQTKQKKTAAAKAPPEALRKPAAATAPHAAQARTRSLRSRQPAIPSDTAGNVESTSDSVSEDAADPAYKEVPMGRRSFAANQRPAPLPSIKEGTIVQLNAPKKTGIVRVQH